MAFGDEAELEIMLSIKKEGERNADEVKESIRGITDAAILNTAAMGFNAVSMEFRALVMASMNARQKEFNEAVKANTVAIAENAAAQVAASGAGGGGLGGFLQAMPGPTWMASLVLGILAVSAALWPFTLLVGSAALALSSFAVQGAGVVAMPAL